MAAIAETITPVQLYMQPLIYYPDDIEDEYVSEQSDTIIIPQIVWNKWSHLYEEGKPMLVDIVNHKTGIERTVCIGLPSQHSNTALYAPKWLLDNIGATLEEDCIVSVEPHLEEVVQASLLVLRPMDTAIYHSDVRDAFEAALDKFHVIQQGALISVEVAALGGYEVSAYVEKTEPEVLVRLGGEVKVEFIEPEGGVEEFVSAARVRAEEAAREEEALAARVLAEAKEEAARVLAEQAAKASAQEAQPRRTPEEIRLARLKYFEKRD